MPFPQAAPTFLAGAVALGVGLLFAVGLLLTNPAFLLAALLGVVAVAAAAAQVELALLFYLLLRPLMRLIPELQVAGQHIGLDGMLNTFLAAGCLVAIPFRRSPPARKAYVWFYLGLLAVCAISLRQSLDPVFGLRQLFRFFTYLLFFWVAYTASSERFAKRLLGVMTVALAMLVFLGAVEALLMLREMSWTQYLVGIAGEGASARRLSGFQGLPHTYSNMLLVLMPAALWLAWRARSFVWRCLFYALLAGALVIVVIAGVRSTLIAFVVSLIVFFVGLRRYKLLAAFLLLFVFAGLATGVFRSRVERFTKSTARLEWNSMVERFESWGILSDATAQRPLQGYGLGSVELFLAHHPAKHSSRPIAAHSDFRKFAFEAGWPALILYSMFWLTILYACWRRRGAGRRMGGVRFGETDLLGRYLCTAAAATGAAWVTIALVDEVLQSFLVMTMWFVMAGAGLGLASKPKDGGSPFRRNGPTGESDPKSQLALGSG